MKAVLVCFIIAFGFFQTYAQTKADFVEDEFIYKGDTLPVRVLYPKNFNPANKYPLVLFLHGRGESGSDNEKQLTHGANMFLDSAFRQDHPAVVVFPQCATDSYWANVKITTDQNGKRHFSFRKSGKPTKAMRLLLKYMDERLADNLYLDRQRYYVGGLSMGGMGTYELLRRKRHKFAAAFAICGGDNPKNVKKYDDVPLWLFHGEKDDVVDPQFTKNIAAELERRGATYKLTLYPNDNHNSWDSAFAEKDLLPWLFSHRRK
ncbi:prolyl oligopeptidase family serine peptidase [Pelobium manganitolerans]|uniref:carboxylesterase family protein n=1 Tax=Pelobium manganitolerans TaxID=1842495 RepID=UPI003FA3BAE3